MCTEQKMYSNEKAGSGLEHLVPDQNVHVRNYSSGNSDHRIVVKTESAIEEALGEHPNL